MLTKIFKPGVMVEVWGVQCDWKDVEDEHLDGYLSSGWYRSPLEMDDDAPKPKRGRPAKVAKDDDEE